MKLDEEIAWWTRLVARTDEVGFLAFGMATGLKWAKRYYGARDMTEHDLYYLRSILRQLREFRGMLRDGPTLGGEVLADNIDWLDCFIEREAKHAQAQDEQGRCSALAATHAVDHGVKGGHE